MPGFAGCTGQPREGACNKDLCPRARGLWFENSHMLHCSAERWACFRKIPRNSGLAGGQKGAGNEDIGPRAVGLLSEASDTGRFFSGDITDEVVARTLPC